MESFFHTLKVELVHQRRWATREKARRDLFATIEGYHNRQRIHSGPRLHHARTGRTESELTDCRQNRVRIKRRILEIDGRPELLQRGPLRSFHHQASTDARSASRRDGRQEPAEGRSGAVSVAGWAGT